MNINIPPLPELNSLSTEDKERLNLWMGAFTSELHHMFEHIPFGAGTERVYSPSNYTLKSDLNAGTATATDVANVLCTLLFELKRSGRIT